MTSEGFSLPDIITKRNVAPGVFTAEFLKSVPVVFMDAPFVVQYFIALHSPSVSLGAASDAGDLYQTFSLWWELWRSSPLGLDAV